MAPSQRTDTKDAWREQFRAYRRSLSAASYRARSSIIVQRVFRLLAPTTADVVHCYWPLRERGEVDTRPLISGLRGMGTEIVLPVVASFDPETPTLEHRRYAGPEALRPNQWGIREPVNTETVTPDTLDLVVVPALGASRNGHRLGHGSGYYDAFLQSVSAPRLAVVYDACLRPSLPSAPHDVPMTTIITERNVVHV